MGFGPIDVEQVTGACCRHGEGPVWDARTGRLLWVDMLDGDVLALSHGELSPDELSPDKVGRFYCGSMAYAALPGAGSLFWLDHDLSVETVLEDVTVSNGIVWSLDGGRVYYIDTPTQRIDVFDFDMDTG